MFELHPLIADSLASGSYTIPPILAILTTAIVWTLVVVVGDRTQPRVTRPPDQAGTAIRELFVNRIISFGFLGLVPVIVASAYGQDLSALGLRWATVPGTGWWVFLPLVVLLPAIAISGAGGKSLDRYPHLRMSVWSPGLAVVDLAHWVLYLAAYEFCFRGFLLYACLPWGVGPAIAINVLVYAGAHVPKGMREVIGALPFGIYVCVVTLVHGSIWIAFALHLAIAIVNEVVSLRAHPEMTTAGQLDADTAKTS